MPPVAYIQDIAQFAGQDVTLRGWLHNRRSSGKIHFLIVRDGTGFIQVVMSKADIGEELFAKADHLSQETSIIVTGTVRADARAKGGFELTGTGFTVVAEAHDYPITPKEHGVDYLMDRRHLWIRSQRQQSVLRVRHEVIDAVRDFFNSRGFILADTPIFTPSACEGTTTLFPVQYFEDTTAYLTQSGQLYNEANAMALGKTYCFGPDVPRGEEQDAPAPHRVLDGRARGRLRHPGRHHGPGRAVGRIRGVARAGQATPRTRATGTRHVEARDGDDAVPAHLVYGGHRPSEGRRPAGRVGRRLRRHRTRRCSRGNSTDRCWCTAIRPRSRRST